MEGSTIEKVREVEIILLKHLTMVPRRLRKLDIFDEMFIVLLFSMKYL